ncbi:hypothetical protein ACWGI8_06460 [Streptomyces sp. NPDC054841]
MTEAMSRHDRRMYAIMNSREGAAAYATVTRRRMIVGAHVLLTAASVVAWTAMTLGDAWWPMFALAGLLLPWCVVTGFINASTRGLLELRGRVLDERQRSERDRVQARAQRLATWLLFGATAGAGAVSWFGGLRGEVLIFPVLFAVLVAHWLMPLWIAGLRVQDEPGDEPADGLAGDLGME